jgi:hypothetical protein
VQVDDSDRRPAGSRRTNRSKFAPSRSEATHCGRGIATLTTRTSRQTRSRRASRKGHVIPTFSTGRLPATYKCTFLTRQTRSQCSPCPFALGACPRFFSEGMLSLVGQDIYSALLSKILPCWPRYLLQMPFAQQILSLVGPDIYCKCLVGQDICCKCSNLFTPQPCGPGVHRLELRRLSTSNHLPPAQLNPIGLPTSGTDIRPDSTIIRYLFSVCHCSSS